MGARCEYFKIFPPLVCRGIFLNSGSGGGVIRWLTVSTVLCDLGIYVMSNGCTSLVGGIYPCARPLFYQSVHLLGNPVPTSFFSASTTPFYNLLYLEVAGCRLSSLPATISSLFPNLRVLNLNYNFLDEADVCALLGGTNAPDGSSNSAGCSGGLGRLRKLMIVGSRVRSMKKIVGLLSRLREVELLDFR